MEEIVVIVKLLIFDKLSVLPILALPTFTSHPHQVKQRWPVTVVVPLLMSLIVVELKMLMLWVVELLALFLVVETWVPCHAKVCSVQPQYHLSIISVRSFYAPNDHLPFRTPYDERPIVVGVRRIRALKSLTL